MSAFAVGSDPVLITSQVLSSTMSVLLRDSLFEAREFPGTLAGYGILRSLKCVFCTLVSLQWCMHPVRRAGSAWHHARREKKTRKGNQAHRAFI